MKHKEKIYDCVHNSKDNSLFNYLSKDVRLTASKYREFIQTAKNAGKMAHEILNANVGGRIVG